ncbi:DNA replication protein [Levilactobacillus acidifarinae DSM 19394]|uniref:DNA replication protein n=2 Tax=Levilactobacillus acidifarinae TaxID=267364 RepID=A0A0R1LKU0_9LACO|nr:DNA replication protein [Levilactobacillus acidifarinae DSM 19394]
MIKLPDKPAFCPKCQQEKIAAHERKTVMDAETYWKKRKTTDVLSRDSIFDDPNLKTATFDNFEATSQEAETNKNRARTIAGQYLKADTQFNTLFTGLPGRGKSHLALAMLKAVNEYAERPMSCLFVSVNELMRLVKDSFNYPDSKYTEANMVELLGNVDLLVIDDLGSESSFKRDSREASEFTQNVLFGVLNKRNRTIITTNLNSKELTAIYNPKLISRMYRGIKDHIIKFTDKTPDQRSVEF